MKNLNNEELIDEFIKIIQDKLIINTKYNLTLIDKVLTNKELNILSHFLETHRRYKCPKGDN